MSLVQGDGVDASMPRAPCATSSVCEIEAEVVLAFCHWTNTEKDGAPFDFSSRLTTALTSKTKDLPIFFDLN